MSASIKCGNKKCSETAFYFCPSDKQFTCAKCMTKIHQKCEVEGIKTKRDLQNLVKYSKKMIKRLKEICEQEIAQLMLESDIKVLKTYFFEFSILLSQTKKFKEDANCTKIFWSINQLLKEMKSQDAYSKIIEFEFEQSIKQEIEEETSASSKKTGNVFSKIIWKQGDECFSISEGINESVIQSEHTGEHDTECSEFEDKEHYHARKSKFAVEATPTSPEIRVHGSSKERAIDNFRSKLAGIEEFKPTKKGNCLCL